MPRTLPHAPLPTLLVEEFIREIAVWAFQEGDHLRRLLDVSASLCIAMQGVRGNYAPSAWYGDAAIMMNRINDHLAVTAPEDAALHYALYLELLQKILAHPAIKAFSGAYA